jgi:tetrahydromethanopterin S-methyltransferase subunit H
LYKFEKEQRIIEVGGVKLGGQPGELQTVIIGSLLHRGHRIVKNREKGVFDCEEAERLIKLQEELSEKTFTVSFMLCEY